MSIEVSEKDNDNIKSDDLENMKKAFDNKSVKVEHNAVKFNGSFTDMKISNVGYGIDEYKTSKPNIVKNEAVIKEILNISDATETAIGHTIGPYADETLIQSYADDNVPIFNTRDGYTILQKMRFTQAIPNAIFKIIKETSEFMQDKIGDSTSSGIPIQNSLLKDLYKVFNDSNKGRWNFSPVGIRNISVICAEEILKGITDNPIYQKSFGKPANGTEYSKEESDEIIKWLTKIATISANNDYTTGSAIANLYRNKLDGRGTVLVTPSKTEEEYVEETNAFVVYSGLLDHGRMSNSSDGMTCEMDKPLIAMFDGELLENDLPALEQIVETAAFDLKRPIFICAGGYNIKIAQYFIGCLSGSEYNSKGEHLNDPKCDPDSKPMKIQLAACILRNKETMEQYNFDDVMLMTNAKAFSTEITTLQKLSDNKETRAKILENIFGSCEKLTSSYMETCMFGCKPDKVKFDKRVSELNEKLESLKHVKFHVTDMNQSDVQQRLDRLESKTTIFYCGGRTDKSKYSRKLVVEDAVCSVKAAIANGGISIGGNIAISHYINNNFDELTDKIIDNIANKKINITAAENYETLKQIVSSILESIEDSFGQAYRYALYNMYRDSKKAYEKWHECIDCKTPTIYNIMTNMNEEFDSNDVDKCTTIIVPKNTDKCLLTVIIETVGELINVGNMITLMSPGLDLEQLQIKQLESGAAYAASNTIMKK